GLVQRYCSATSSSSTSINQSANSVGKQRRECSNCTNDSEPSQTETLGRRKRSGVEASRSNGERRWQRSRPFSLRSLRVLWRAHEINGVVAERAGSPTPHP